MNKTNYSVLILAILSWSTVCFYDMSHATVNLFSVFDSPHSIPEDINLNDGTFYLERDLSLYGNTMPSGFNTFIGNGHLFDISSHLKSMNSPCTLDSIFIRLHDNLTFDATITFQGHCVIRGDDCSILLGPSGRIIVSPNAVVELRDVKLVGATKDNIICVDNTACLRLRSSGLNKNPTHRFFKVDQEALADDNKAISLLESMETCCDALHYNTQSLDSSVDERFAEIDLKIDQVESLIDECHDFFVEPSALWLTCMSKLEIVEHQGHMLDNDAQNMGSFLDKCGRSIKNMADSIQQELEALSFDRVTDKVAQSSIEALEKRCEDAHLNVRKTASDLENLYKDLDEGGDYVQSHIDLLKKETEIETISTLFLSQIEDMDSCCDTLEKESMLLQSQLDDFCTVLNTGTGVLQSNIDQFTRSYLDECAVYLLSVEDKKFLGGIEYLEGACAQVGADNDQLRSQVDECWQSIGTSTAELQSEIDLLHNHGALALVDKEIVSTIDELEDCFGSVDSELDKIESSLEICCSELGTSLDQIQSQVDDLRVVKVYDESLLSRLDNLEGSCTDAYVCTSSVSSILVNECSILGTSTNLLQSTIDTIRKDPTLACDCASEYPVYRFTLIDKQTLERLKELETDCDDLTEATDRLHSEIEECFDQLGTSTDELQSQIDFLISATKIMVVDKDVISRLEQLEDCCDTLDTTTNDCLDNLATVTGEFQSMLEDLCTELRVSVSFLDSQFDDCFSKLSTGTEKLQSQIDILLATTLGSDIENMLSSRIELLIECFDVAGDRFDELRSSVDNFSCDCPGFIDCCDIDFVTSTVLSDQVKSVDWSWDSRFLLVAMKPAFPTQDVYSVKVFERMGENLILRNEIELIDVQEITVVRWHPVEYRFAVGRKSTMNQLLVYNFNPINFAITEVGFVEGANVHALAWNPKHTDILAVGRRGVSKNEIEIYDIPDVGPILPSDLLTKTETTGEIQLQAMDWNITGSFLAVGLGDPSRELQIFMYQVPTGDLLLNASSTIPITISDFVLMPVIRSVSWNKGIDGICLCSIDDRGNLLAIGLEGNEGDLLQLYQHEGETGTLTQKAGISEIAGTVNMIDWHPGGKCLALAREGGDGAEFRTYLFNKNKLTFGLSKAFDSFDKSAVNAVRWAPEGVFIAIGCDNQEVLMYRNYCRSMDEVVEILAETHSCFDAIATSTVALRSRIDELQG